MKVYKFKKKDFSDYEKHKTMSKLKIFSINQYVKNRRILNETYGPPIHHTMARIFTYPKTIR